MRSHRYSADTSPFDLVTGDVLLLSEFAHGTASQIAAAAAALRLACKAAKPIRLRLLSRPLCDWVSLAK
jgi:hypothetical protein